MQLSVISWIVWLRILSTRSTKLHEISRSNAHSLHRELELYVKAGLTPLEAIQAATITPARVMKPENEVGTIEAGKRAEIFILDANPLDNISNIQESDSL